MKDSNYDCKAFFARGHISTLAYAINLKFGTKVVLDKSTWKNILKTGWLPWLLVAMAMEYNEIQYGIMGMKRMVREKKNANTFIFYKNANTFIFYKNVNITNSKVDW